MITKLLPVLASLVLLSACSQDDQTASLSEESRACLMAANAMIDTAREAVNDARSRPERRESRRVLMEDWVARLDGGEEPCFVYADIGQASINF